jgi:hypothetical protein
MKKIIVLIGIVTLSFTANVFGQLTLPQASTRQQIMQGIGDAQIVLTYNRPNVKGRTGKIFGCSTTQLIQQGNNTGDCLVPNGQVWRAGANENTIIEFSTDVTINGQNLPAGKYGFFALPQKNEWTLIFNKVNNEWGAFTYKAEQDALRVKVKPMKLKDLRESMMYEFNNVVGNSADVTLSWEKTAVSFTVNIGDLNGRLIGKIREAVKNAKPDDMRTLNQGANFVLTNKLSANYDEALGWLNKSVSIRETFGNLNTKARLLAEMGKKSEAIEIGNKAVEVGKAAKPAVDTADFEKTLNMWKAKK